MTLEDGMLGEVEVGNHIRVLREEVGHHIRVRREEEVGNHIRVLVEEVVEEEEEGPVFYMLVCRA